MVLMWTREQLYWELVLSSHLGIWDSNSDHPACAALCHPLLTPPQPGFRFTTESEMVLSSLHLASTSHRVHRSIPRHWCHVLNMAPEVPRMPGKPSPNGAMPRPLTVIFKASCSRKVGAGRLHPLSAFLREGAGACSEGTDPSSHARCCPPQVLELYGNLIASMECLCSPPPPNLQHLGLGHNKLLGPLESLFVTSNNW